MCKSGYSLVDNKMKSSNNHVQVGLETNKLNSITRQSEIGNDPKRKANHASGSEDGSAKGQTKGRKDGDGIGTCTYLKGLCLAIQVPVLGLYARNACYG
ncbi:unnamed protein product [Lactuca virosa]|uniref:Uncharacterized protein n=1 Tax=Lactuca virosa TaxID=75947 RepID=A0AAU9N4W8_9ASTR|nr:unnamed protein product [Lactuca virosa]